MAKETKEERRLRIQKEVAEESAARREAYFKAQEESKAKSAAAAAPLPQPDAYVYDYAWRQGVGTPEGQLKLIKSPNPYYDASTNEIVDPVTGARRPATQSMVSGASTSSNSLYDAKRAAGYGMDTQGNQYRGAGTQSDPLTINGSPFTGTWQGKTYENGIVKTVTSSSVTTQPVISTGLNSATTAAATDALLAFNKAQAAAETQAKRESAFAILKKEFDKYGLGSLVDSVKNLILTGSSPEEVVLKLRETPEYLKRFAGNKLRLDAGLNVYDEATYLDLENAYDQIFTSYGVEEAVGNTRDARRAKYAEFIGGTKSPDEIKGRVQLAVLASQEDAVTKATMKELYPMITDKDLVSYFLNPKETLPKLETKIRAAQVGAAAVRQGLVTNVATAEELVGLGITEDQAEKGYAAYAGMKPRLDFLSSLEKDQQSIVDQQVAEGALLKNLASEQRKILNLQQKEEGRFGGASGAARGVSLSKQLGGTY